MKLIRATLAFFAGVAVGTAFSLLVHVVLRSCNMIDLAGRDWMTFIIWLTSSCIFGLCFVSHIVEEHWS